MSTNALRRYRSEQALRRRLRGELAALHITRPVSMEEVCERLAERRGKPIQLLSYPLEVPGPFGLWLSTTSAEIILYQSETTRLHQQHIIAHELGHVLANHNSDDGEDAVWHELMPDIPPDVIRRALRRTSYDRDEERQAEIVATMLEEKAAVAEAIARPAATGRANRVQHALGDQQESWL